VDVFGDFLRYLRGCARDYIRETYAGGADLWQSLEQDIQFVLSHPNGWRGLQQRQMRRAAVSGGLVPDSSDGHSRLLFVTEGEACLHFCLQSGFVSDSIRVCASRALKAGDAENSSCRAEMEPSSLTPVEARWISVLIA
jgi:hypothetical protein